MFSSSLDMQDILLILYCELFFYQHPTLPLHLLKGHIKYITQKICPATTTVGKKIPNSTEFLENIWAFPPNFIKVIHVLSNIE